MHRGFHWARTAKRAVRRVAMDALHASGILVLWQRYMLHGKAVVLMYHRVLPDDILARTASHPGIVVRQRTFERHLRLLARHFTVMAPADFAECLRARRPFPRGACLITFDDGWADTYSSAWPLLQRYRTPALVFMPVDYIGTGRVFWQEQLQHLLDEVRRRATADVAWANRAARVLADAGLSGLLDVRDEAAGEWIADAIQQRKQAGAAGVEPLIAQLRALLGPEVPAARSEDGFMTWPMAREMATDGVTFGAHTATHRLLTTLTPDEVQAEICVSRDAVRRELDAPVLAFSYPNGNWNRAVAEAVRDAGFAVSFSTQPGWVGVDDDPFTLRRINVQEDMTSTEGMFMARILGVV